MANNNFQIDELWSSMCQTAITLISEALHEVRNAELLLKIKSVIALFIQTMEVRKLKSTFRNSYENNTS